VVEVVKGDRDPDTIPGFIGSVNELENATSLGGFKRAFFAANWLLIDEGERDEGGPGFVDYDALIKGKPAGTTAGGYYRVASPSTPRYGSGTYRGWPSTTTRAPVSGSRTSRTSPIRPAEPRSYGTQFFQSSAAASSPPGGDPFERIKDRYHAPNGQQYPLLVRGLKTNPISMTKKADAIYYDGELKRWREIVDDEAQVALAKEVEAGQLEITKDWHNFL
jgi:hypothetical protein